MSHPPKPDLTSFARDGFLILPSALPLTDLADLRTAAQTATTLARSGQWPHIRTLPRQFPPWPRLASSQGLWGVQHLMHPDLPHHELFTKFYFSERVIGVVRELLGGCGEEELVMELLNLLVRPDRDFELVWHRDDIPATATAEQELSRLNQPSYHAQWNLALYDDTSLLVIPGSHKRARTDFERAADSYEADMPSQLVVKLEAGDIMFYDNNILHRGVYDCAVERMTLHGSMGHADGGSYRARNVLQHGKGWMERIDLSLVEDRGRAERMRDRLVALAERHEVTEYSLDG